MAKNVMTFGTLKLMCTCKRKRLQDTGNVNEQCDSIADGYTTIISSSCGTITGLSLNVEGTAVHETSLFKSEC